MTTDYCVTKEQAIALVFHIVSDILDAGMKATEVARYVGVSDRTVRRWLAFESEANALYFRRLCELKASLEQSA